MRAAGADRSSGSARRRRTSRSRARSRTSSTGWGAHPAAACARHRCSRPRRPGCPGSAHIRLCSPPLPPPQPPPATLSNFLFRLRACIGPPPAAARRPRSSRLSCTASRAAVPRHRSERGAEHEVATFTQDSHMHAPRLRGRAAGRPAGRRRAGRSP